MYASPIVLIFSTPCLAASASHRANTPSSSATISDGARRSASGVKPTMSANSTVTASWASAITPSSRFRRSATGGGQHVEQQALRPSLLALASAHEVLEQQVARGRDAEDGQPEEGEYDAARDVGGARRDRRVDRDRHADESDERHEPRNRLTRSDEQQRTQRRGERPERDGRGGLEATEAPLQGERQQQAHPELAAAEQPVPSVRAKATMLAAEASWYAKGIAADAHRPSAA